MSPSVRSDMADLWQVDVLESKVKLVADNSMLKYLDCATLTATVPDAGPDVVFEYRWTNTNTVGEIHWDTHLEPTGFTSSEPKVRYCTTGKTAGQDTVAVEVYLVQLDKRARLGGASVTMMDLGEGTTPSCPPACTVSLSVGGAPGSCPIAGDRWVFDPGSVSGCIHNLVTPCHDKATTDFAAWGFDVRLYDAAGTPLNFYADSCGGSPISSTFVDCDSAVQNFVTACTNYNANPCAINISTYHGYPFDGTNKTTGADKVVFIPPPGQQCDPDLPNAGTVNGSLSFTLLPCSCNPSLHGCLCLPKGSSCPAEFGNAAENCCSGSCTASGKCSCSMTWGKCLSDADCCSGKCTKQSSKPGDSRCM